MKNKKNIIKNAWMKEVFIPSFGLCKDKKISKKQADVFIKYLEFIPTTFGEHGYTDAYYAVCEEKTIVLVIWHSVSGDINYLQVVDAKNVNHIDSMGIIHYVDENGKFYN